MQRVRFCWSWAPNPIVTQKRWRPWPGGWWVERCGWEGKGMHRLQEKFGWSPKPGEFAEYSNDWRSFSSRPTVVNKVRHNLQFRPPAKLRVVFLRGVWSGGVGEGQAGACGLTSLITRRRWWWGV